jgi:hypothetical protein
MRIEATAVKADTDTDSDPDPDENAIVEVEFPINRGCGLMHGARTVGNANASVIGIQDDFGTAAFDLGSEHHSIAFSHGCRQSIII